MNTFEISMVKLEGTGLLALSYY